jgi:hypothetical protein
MFHGKRTLSFPDLKSSFTAKDRKSPFPDLSREKKIFKDEIKIIEVPVWIFWPVATNEGVKSVLLTES